MNDFFDKYADKLAYALRIDAGDKIKENGYAVGGQVTGNTAAAFDGNSIGQAIGHIFGGQDTGDTDTSNPGLAVSNVLANASKTNSGRNTDNALGQGFYNSPLYIAQHYTQAGKFFNATEPGNFYTNKYKTPTETQPTPSTKLKDFTDAWYLQMRSLAQAEEVATRGSPQIRSK